MQLNVPPDLEALIKNAFRAAAIRVLKTYSAALLKRRTPKKAGATRNAVPCALIEEGYLQAERGELIDGRHVCHFDL
jgi:hypothetical protein